MMPYRRSRTSQPQGVIGIDWSNPITRGLLTGVNIATGSDHKGNRISLISGASYTPTSDGIGILSNGSSSYGLMNINQKTYSELTIVAVTIPVSLATSRTIVDVGHSSNANPIFRITTGNTDSSKIRFWLRGDNGGTLNSLPDSTDTAFVVGKKSVLSFYAKGSSGKCYCYINGKKDVAGTTTIANTWTIDRLSIGVAYFGGSTGDFYNGNTPLALLYERELSGEEHRALSDNPWQIFKPRTFLLGSLTSPQLLYPTGDVAGGTWLASTGTDLFACIDETVASDADYIYTTVPGSYQEFSFADGGAVDPSTGGHVRYRLPAGTGTIVAVLKQGSTTLQTLGTHTLTGSAQDIDVTITASVANSTDLRVGFTASA